MILACYTIPVQFSNGDKCDGSTILTGVHTKPTQFENGRKFDGNKPTSLLLSFQEFDAKDI